MHRTLLVKLDWRIGLQYRTWGNGWVRVAGAMRLGQGNGRVECGKVEAVVAQTYGHSTVMPTLGNPASARQPAASSRLDW
jgi:hypothetical protein